MATSAPGISDQIELVEADDQTALAALDYTCEYYLGISAGRFIEMWDAGQITPEQARSNAGIARAVDMLAFVRP